MSQSQTFHCPSCHAALDYKPGDGVLVRCDYCNNSVIVPEDLRTEAATSYPAGSSARNLAAQLEKIMSLVRANKKEEAIALYHSQFPSSLSQAKKVIDLLEQGQGVSVGQVTVQTTSRPNQSYVTPVKQKEVYTTGCWTWLVLLFFGLLTCGPVGLAMTQPGGPLFNIWVRLNPLAYSRANLIFGEEGLGQGQFYDLRSVAVDPAGNIIAADYQSGRIQLFDSSGNFQSLWQFDQELIISALDAGPDGTIYAILGGDLHRLSSPAGTDLGQIPHPNNEYFYFDDIAITHNGDVVAIGEDTLVYLSQTGALRWSLPGRELISNFSDFERLDLDSQDNIYVLGATSDFRGQNEVIFKFTADGQYASQFSGSGEEKGQLDSPYDLAVDSQGQIYVGHWPGIEVLDGSGRYITRLPVNTYPFGLFISNQNELFITTNNNQIYRYTLP